MGFPFLLTYRLVHLEFAMCRASNAFEGVFTSLEIKGGNKKREEKARRRKGILFVRKSESRQGKQKRNKEKAGKSQPSNNCPKGKRRPQDANIPCRKRMGMK